METIWELWKIGLIYKMNMSVSFSIVDLHSLTSSFEDTSKLQDNINEMAIDWLSAGLDPEKKCHLYSVTC